MIKTESIEKIREVWMNQSTYQKYLNNCVESGWLFYSPNSMAGKNGSTLTSFVLTKVNKNNYQMIVCHTVSNKVREELEKLTCVSLVNCVGKLSYNCGKKIVFMVEEIKITESVPSVKLETNSFDRKGE